MSSHPTEVTKLIPPDILLIFGPPPLLPTEDVEAYYQLLVHLAKDIDPQDAIAWMLLKDLADDFVEVARWRGIKAAIIRRAADGRLRQLEGELCRGHEEIDVLAVRAGSAITIKEAAQNPATKPDERNKRVRELSARSAADVATVKKDYEQRRANLETVKASQHDIYAATLDDWIYKTDKVDKLLEIAEARLLRTRRDLGRHMVGFGRVLKECRDKTIDGNVVQTDGAVNSGRSAA